MASLVFWGDSFLSHLQGALVAVLWFCIEAPIQRNWLFHNTSFKVGGVGKPIKRSFFNTFVRYNLI